MIRLPQWQFVQDERREWHWSCATENVRVVCACSFADRADCVADAMQTAGAAGDALTAFRHGASGRDQLTGRAARSRSSG